MITTVPALVVFLFNFILKFVPDYICPELGDESEDAKEKSKQEYLMLKKFREGSSLRQGSFVKNK